MCPNQEGFDEEFHSNRSRAGLLTRLRCVQGLRWWSPNLDELLWSFNLASGGFLVAPPLICCCSVLSDSATPWTAALQASLSFTMSQSLLKPMSIESVMPSNHLMLCHPLLLPSIFHSIRVFSNELSLCIMWPNYWSFSFSISPSNEYSGSISFRIDLLDLLESKGLSLLQHHSWKASVLWRSAFFMVQLSHPYMTTGKTIALTRWTFVGKVMSLTFGTQGRSWGLESCLEEMEGEKGFHAQEPHRVLLSFNRSRYWLQVWLLTNSDDEMESTAWYQTFKLWVGILGWNCTTLIITLVFFSTCSSRDRSLGSLRHPSALKGIRTVI